MANDTQPAAPDFAERIVSILTEIFSPAINARAPYAKAMFAHAARVISQAAQSSASARIAEMEDLIEALKISEATLNRAVASEVHLRNVAYKERVEVAEAKAARLERALTEADHTIWFLAGDNAFKCSGSMSLRWLDEALKRHAARSAASDQREETPS